MWVPPPGYSLLSVVTILWPWAIWFSADYIIMSGIGFVHAIVHETGFTKWKERPKFHLSDIHSDWDIPDKLKLIDFLVFFSSSASLFSKLLHNTAVICSFHSIKKASRGLQAYNFLFTSFYCNTAMDSAVLDNALQKVRQEIALQKNPPHKCTVEYRCNMIWRK